MPPIVEIPGSGRYDAQSMYYALKFILTHANYYVRPEFDVDDDGWIELTWHESDADTLTVTFAPDGNLFFTGKVAGDAVSGRDLDKCVSALNAISLEPG